MSSQLCRQLQVLIDKVLADEGLQGAISHWSRFLRAYAKESNLADDFPPTRFYDHCIDAAKQDAVLFLQNIVWAVQNSGGWPAHPLLNDLICHMSLVGYERYLAGFLAELQQPEVPAAFDSSERLPAVAILQESANLDSPVPADDLPLTGVHLDEETAAGVVAAIWLGCGLTITVEQGHGPQYVRLRNVVTIRGTSEVQRNHVDLRKCYFLEINAKLNQVPAPGLANPSKYVAAEALRVRLKKYERDLGAPFMICIRAGEASVVLPARLQQELKSIGAKIVLLQETAPAEFTAWEESRDLLRGHFSSVLMQVRSIGAAPAEVHSGRVVPEPPSTRTNHIKVFVSYAHSDEPQHLHDVVKFLKGIEVLGDIELWDDRQIGAGEAWELAIRERLQGCKVGVLLLSQDFLNSKFIRQTEISQLIDRQLAGAMLMPILIKQCTWKREPWLKHLQIRPGGQPLARTGQKRDAQLTRIAEEIARFCEGQRLRIGHL